MDLERSLERIFSPPIVWRVASFTDDLRELHDSEAEQIPRALGKRRQEFRAGRHCAHSALEALGGAIEGIRADARGAPLWPPGVVGSIAHTGKLGDGWALAAVAPGDSFAAIGVDVEASKALGATLVPRIVSEQEVAQLDASACSVEQWGKIAFSCKEAAYKCQYPLSKEFLEFHDFEFEAHMEPEVGPSGIRHGVFRVRFQRDAGRFKIGDPLFGRFAQSPEWIVSGVTLGA